MRLNKFFFIFTPIITFSNLVALPSNAAIFQSEGVLSFSNLNQIPTALETSRNTDVVLRARNNSIAIGEAFADNIIFSQPLSSLLPCESQLLVTPAACNITTSQIEVQGSDYFASAISQATVLGGLTIASGETFSFDFSALLSLQTQADDLMAKSFSTSGELSLKLYTLSEDTTNPSIQLLDSLTLFGNLNTLGNGDRLELVKSSDRFQFSKINTSSLFGGTDESAKALIKGSYSRFFEQDATLILVGENTTQIAIIPESSSRLTVLIFGLFGSVAIGLSKKNESK